MKNILNLIFVSTLSFYSFASFGVSINEVEENFKQRTMEDEGFEKILEVVTQGTEIFNDESLPEVVRAKGIMFACRAKNFRGEYLPAPRSERKIEFWEGAQLCKKGIRLLEQELGVPKNPEDSETLAELYFWHTTVFGRWFEDERKLDALKYWKTEIKPTLMALIDIMGMGDLYGMGPFRALGRAYYSIPASKKKSLKFMKKAYMKSRSKVFKVSVYPLNTAYYAESLIARGKDDEAREVLEATLEIADDEEALKQLNEEAEILYGDYRWPETLYEIDMCREVLQSLK